MDCIVYGVTKGQTRLSYFHFFLKESALLPHHPQHSGVYVVPTLLSLHTLLVLDWAGQPERRGIPPAPADLTFSSLAAFLADPGTKQGNASWGGREHAIPPASQGSEPQQTVSNEHTWPPGQQTTGFHAREMAEANFVFQIAFVFHQLL